MTIPRRPVGVLFNTIYSIKPICLASPQGCYLLYICAPYTHDRNTVYHYASHWKAIAIQANFRYQTWASLFASEVTSQLIENGLRDVYERRCGDKRLRGTPKDARYQSSWVYSSFFLLLDLQPLFFVFLFLHCSPAVHIQQASLEGDKRLQARLAKEGKKKKARNGSRSIRRSIRTLALCPDRRG